MLVSVFRDGPRSWTASDGTRQRRRWTIGAFLLSLAVLLLAGVGALVWRNTDRRARRQEFSATALNVTHALGTQLRRDLDFISTIRALLVMQPHLTPSAFATWYDAFQSADRQFGGLGSAVVESVPVGQVRAFQARRNADPAFQAVVGNPLAIPRGARPDACLLAASVVIVPLDPSTSRSLQQDWCDPATSIGKGQAPLARVFRDTGDDVAFTSVGLGVQTMVIEAPFYRRGAPLTTVAQRRAAYLGWVLSTFDPSTLVGTAADQGSGLAVSLYHRNPGGPWIKIAAAGPRARTGSWSRTLPLATDGDWLAKVEGKPVATMSPDVQAVLVFCAGAVVALLLFLVLMLLIRSRSRALGMVEKTTGELRHQAMHDGLTGLPNRALAVHRAEQMLACARDAEIPIAALHVDIDGFKLINDTFGHRIGDQCLQIIAERLYAVVREGDTVARFSGDEFVVLLGESTLGDGSHHVAERVLEAVRAPFHVDSDGDGGRPLTLSVSIGVAHGIRDSAEELIADASVATGVAKRTGKNRFVTFESGMQAASHDRLKLEMDLAGALERGELFLMYQPTFDLRSERTIGAEALLRWRHPTRGLIPPDTFVPIAEESGLILAIGRWVLEQACRQGAQWRRRGHILDLSVNVSAVQLENGPLIEDVQRALARSGLPPTSLTLEITETTLMLDAEATAERLAALKRLGVRIAIDDFGTGYSSLAYLRQFPVDSLKIDRSFVKGITTSAESAALINTLVRLGKALKLETLAEGIEDRAQLRALQNQQCDHGQGYLISRPLDVEALDEFLDRQTHRLLVS